MVCCDSIAILTTATATEIMGEEQSKPQGEGGEPAGHQRGGPPAPAAGADLSPAQKFFSQSFKCTKIESFPLMQLDIGDGKEYKYMDTRGSSMIFGGGGVLHFEMFWTGELEGLDQARFKAAVADVLVEKYGAKCEGGLREAGCMISMIAYPFAISEENAMRLGHSMFTDFENPPAEAPK
jgi:hypothetical protein